MTAEGTRRWWALGALALALVAVGLDATVLNLALPTLATSLHASTGDLQWFVDAYSLVFAATLLPAGLLGDRFGRKRLLLLALGVFGMASLACAAASSTAQLIAARAALGFGGAFLVPLSMAVLTVLFTEEERPRAIGIWVAANAVSWPIGPILGGWLLSHFWWGSVFLINVPVVALGMLAVAAWLPESRSSRPPRLDVVGVLTSSLGLAGITYGAIEAGEKGWGDLATVGSLVVGAVLLGVFWLAQRAEGRRPGGQPLVDLDLFRSRGFTWGTLLTTVVSFAMFGLLFAVPQYFQAVVGTDPLGTGVRLLPIIGGLLVGSQIATQLARVAGARATIAAGFVLLAGGLAIGATTAVGSGDAFAATWIGIVGLGMGFTLPTAMDAALGSVSKERSGVGSALIQAVRQVGATIGVAILGTLINSAYRGQVAVAGLPASVADTVRQSASAGAAVARQLGSVPLAASVDAAFVTGMDRMLWICAALMVAGAVLAAAFLASRVAPASVMDLLPAESAHDAVA